MPDRRRLLELAIQGLKSSATALQKEIVDLEHELMAVSKGVATGVTSMAVPQQRRRLRLSVASRKAQSTRMKQYWAERRRISGAKKAAGPAGRYPATERTSITRGERKAAAGRMKAELSDRRTKFKAT